MDSVCRTGARSGAIKHGDKVICRIQRSARHDRLGVRSDEEPGDVIS